MSWNDRVVWSEGQFLLPQMFQQQERYLEHVMHYRSLPLTPFFWGFSHYNIDGEALNIGKLILKEASGIFPDGTPFNAPDHTPLPPPLTILPEHLNQQICLAVPVRAPNSEETTFDNNPESLARFSVHEHDIRDANSLGRGAQLLQLSHLRLRLLPEKAVTGAWIGLPLTRITGLNPDGRIDIDHDLIPPIINYQASSLMCTWLSWINDLIRMRADSLAERLEAIEQIFLDSKFDATQLNNTLRGVFFTSAAQAQADAVADQLSIWQRFVRAIKTARGESSASLPHALPDGNRSYFLHDLLTQFIFREAHLVEPNLQWAWRYRLLRLGGHLLVLVLAFLLWQGMQTSQQTNGDYLNEISARATRLDGEVKAYTGKPAKAPVPALLDSARELSAWPELDPDAPPLTWRYGLYSVPPVTDSVASLYNRLLDQLLLPPLVKRTEYVLADAIARQDSKAAYDALRIYLLLNLDKDHEDKYNAAEIQSWVINDLGNSDSVAGFGGRAAVLTHIEALFDGSRVVHSPYEKDEALIRQARAFLDGHTSTERIYARALAAMESEAPQEFTLVRAVGADAGAVFVRSNGAPLDRGVPGIFTREGYRELFDKRLPEFVAAATANDGWVMGRESTPKKLTGSLRSQIPGQEQSVAREVRRLYLTEYARRWQDFLDSIHSINSAGEEGSSGLAYDLQVLRTLASPDSPLMRLGKAVVEQTTLVPPPDPQARQKQLAQRASGNAGKVVQTAKLFQDIHPEERLEKTLVDDRFAALREVIAGRTDGGQSGGGTMQIASLLTMLNEYYTQLTIADSALAAGTLPARITAADKLQLEAAKLPAPLKNILLDLTKQGTRKINAGTGDVLNTQMEAMMGDDCRDAIDGRYPFADSPQEVSAEDFNRIFASGGVLDAFWSKQLAPLVDTASDPWRYKPTEGNMTLQGPDLTPFQQAKQIRSVFFNSEGGKKFSWSMQISVVDMDPAITELVIDIDGQVLPWPGPAPESDVAGTAQRLDGGNHRQPAYSPGHLNATDRRAVGAVSSAGRRKGTGNGGAGAATGGI